MQNQESQTNISYQGGGLAVFFLIAKLVIFTPLTLGIYYFWGKTNLRQYIWSHTYFKGHPFKYTGDPAAIFVGSIKVILLFLAYSVVTLLVGWIPIIGWAISALGAIALIVIAPYVIYYSKNYRLKNTEWNESRLYMTQDIRGFAAIFYRGAVFTFFTFGLYLPWFYNNLMAALTERTRWSGKKFQYRGQAEDLVIDFIAMLFLTPITGGAYLVFFFLRMKKYYLENLDIEGTTFNLQTDTSELATNFVIACIVSVVTLGLGIPFMLNYLAKEFLNSIHVNGDFNPPPFHLLATDEDAMAEGAAEALDMDFGL